MLGQSRVRLRASWAFAPIYLVFAQPSPMLIAVSVPFALAGLALRAWAASVIEKNRVLATRGAYAYTRNPLYLGSFLIGTGLAIAGGRVAFFVVLVGFFLLVYRRAMQKEADRLEDLFGDEYRAYAAEVPIFLPRLRPYSAADGEPSARSRLTRYLANREYQAALGLLVAFLALGAKIAWL